MYTYGPKNVWVGGGGGIHSHMKKRRQLTRIKLNMVIQSLFSKISSVKGGPVPALCRLNCTHQRPKIAEKGVFKVKIRMSVILRKKGSFLDRNSQKSGKGDVIHPTLLSYLVI